jgi:hypothetical protein
MEYKKSLGYHEKSLDLKGRHLPDNHPDMGASYNNIDLAHYYLNQNDLTLKNYDRALVIFENSHPPNSKS